MRPLLIATALLLLAPASALGAVRHVVRGAGYGHGVGMSQYGAYGFAQQGRGYRSILAHYYRGTQLGQADTRTIRVLLRDGARSLSFVGADLAADRRMDPSAPTARRRATARWRSATPTGGSRGGSPPRSPCPGPTAACGCSAGA